MKLSYLSVLLGLGLGLPQVLGLARPAQLAAAAKKFPRNLPAGVPLFHEHAIGLDGSQIEPRMLAEPAPVKK